MLLKDFNFAFHTPDSSDEIATLQVLKTSILKYQSKILIHRDTQIGEKNEHDSSI